LECVYIGTAEIAPVFDIKFWSCNEKVRLSIPRTTNSLEAWHRSLNSKFNVAHPNFAEFIEVLRMENERVRVEISQLTMNVKVNKMKLVKEEKLRNIVFSFMLYENIEFFENLDGVLEYNFD
jgi:hypothetical protein